MSLEPTSFHVRAYAGRDDAFREAMARAEGAAEAKPKPDFRGRTSFGQIVRHNGDVFTPGPMMDRDVFESLPLLDE